MKRHIITLGGSTTAGGTVLMASAHGSINRKNIALEGDSVFCPTCNSTGKIKCVGPRIDETWNEKKVALENDLCICGCAAPPRLIANQCLRYQMIGGTSSSGISNGLADSMSPSGSQDPVPDPSEKRRMKEVIRHLNTSCKGTDKALARLRSKYANDGRVISRLRDYEDEIEPHPEKVISN